MPPSFIVRNRYYIHRVSATVSVMTAALGLYFMWKWLRLIYSADFELRERLMGRTFAEVLENGEALLAFAFCYFVYRIVMTAMHAANWGEFLRLSKARHREFSQVSSPA